MSDVPDASGLSQLPEQNASFWRRAAAYSLDQIPILAIVLGIVYFFFGLEEAFARYFEGTRDLDSRLEFIAYRNRLRDLSFFLWITYSAIADTDWGGGAIGKRLMGIRVVTASGDSPSIRVAVKRGSAKILSWLPVYLGFVWALFSKQRLAWHDNLTKTRVVRVTATSPNAQQ